LRVRDYKHSRRDALALEAARTRDIAVGLLVGLAFGLTLWLLLPRVLHSHRVPSGAMPPAAPAGAAAPGDASRSNPSTAEASRYDFYQMLPKTQVVVPERAPSSRTPAAAVARPDAYFLQVGSYRDAAVAARVRAQVARLGIDASVQRVAVGADVWHRVRIGPIRDAAILDRVRRQLQAGNLDSLIVRAED
jgi:cell division protein FtsN